MNVYDDGSNDYTRDIRNLKPGAEYTFKIFAQTDSVNRINGQESEVKKTTGICIFLINLLKLRIKTDVAIIALLKLHVLYFMNKLKFNFLTSIVPETV